MTTLAPRTAAPTRSRRDWWIPASLLALAAGPVRGRRRPAGRPLGRAHGGERALLRPARADPRAHLRRDDVPACWAPSSSCRRCGAGARRWHRWSGRVLVPAGLAGGLSGMWMAVFSDVPVHDNAALMWLRLLFGSVMVAGLVLGLAAIRRRDVRTHQRWMARAYAVAQGAGTQALVLGPTFFVRRTSRRAPQGRRDGGRVGASTSRSRSGWCGGPSGRQSSRRD